MRTAVEAFSPDELRAPKRRSVRRESSEAFDDDPAKPAIVDGNSSQEEDDPLVEGQRRVTPRASSLASPPSTVSSNSVSSTVYGPARWFPVAEVRVYSR